MKLLKTLAITSALLLTATASNAVIDGTACWAKNDATAAQYQCYQTFNGQKLTIKEIYQRGYKVVGFDANKARIIIEQQ